MLSVPPVVLGECIGWLPGACPYVWVSVPRDGNLRIEVMPRDGSGAMPPVEVCCVGGDEQQGNPITVPVAGGVELVVKVSIRQGTAVQSFLVKTAYEASSEPHSTQGRGKAGFNPI